MPLPLHFDNTSEFTTDPYILCHGASHLLRAANRVRVLNWHALLCPEHDCIQTSHYPRVCPSPLARQTAKAQRDGSACPASYNQRGAKHNSTPWVWLPSPHRVSMSPLDQSCLLCSGTVTGHNKHTCTQTQKTRRCSLSLVVLPPSLPLLFLFFFFFFFCLPNAYISFKNRQKCQLLHKNPSSSSELVTPDVLTIR